MRRETWIRNGDRTHRNLMVLDSLELSYPGHEEDLARAEHAHTSHPMDFEDRLFELREKQRMFMGDRGHSRLQALDHLTFDYPNWESDARKAEEYHVCFPALFEGKVLGMMEKQRMHHGDRSHPNLCRLDRAKNSGLDYPGHAADVAEAEDIHTSKPFLFDDKMFEIEEKQRMHRGDRSHGRLATLDAMHLTYDGWEEDAARAEHYHVRFPELFPGKLVGMEEKQRIYAGDRSHPNLRALDQIIEAGEVDYPGWREDAAAAEDAHTHAPRDFDALLFEMKEKQRMHQGDRSHPRLQELDSMVLTYPDWQEDVTKAEEYHLRYHELFEGKLNGMHEKQRIYRGSLLRERDDDSDNGVTGLSSDVNQGEADSKASSPRKGNAQKQSSLDRHNNDTKSDHDNDSQKHKKHCIVCMQFERTHAFVPCGHLCVCANCVQITKENNSCPICRKKTTQAIKVYFP